jgi:Holliday junction DNA helicase RuvA
VREDRLTLFGFLRREDRELFTRLIDVSGIGPRTALGILGTHSTGRVVQAITQGDHGFLCKLPGLGRKTSERLTMELKDKLSALEVKLPSEQLAEAPALREEAVQALTTLGMTRGAAEEALDKIDWKSEVDSSLSDIVKQALKMASRI